ncbi:MAG: hypothetical protein HRU11_05970 [Parvularculaceae bacterium]|nr:hypothetical protein [Parvularculaceae bacterium]
MLSKLMIAAAMGTALMGTANAGWERLADAAVPAVQPASKEAPSVMFFCSNGSFSAVMSTQDGDFDVVLSDTSRRVRNVSGSLIINGDEAYSGFFGYKPAVKSVSPKESKPSKKLFNAVVRGDSVVLDLGSKGKFELALPGADQVFSEFAKECRAMKNA